MYTRWRKDGRSFDLGRMSFTDLCLAYSSHPAVHLYLLFAAFSTFLAVRQAQNWQGPLLAIAATILAYPFAWHGIHRFIPHRRWSLAVDRALGTSRGSARARSPHVFDRGYDPEEAARFPWVTKLSGRPPRHARGI